MSWSWRLVVTGVRLGTHYTFENLPGISAWTEDRQMKKSGWDEGREIERQEWETKKDIKSRTEWREAVREESLFKRKAQGREMRVRDLLVLKWLDMFLSVLISGCCGGAGGGGGIEAHSNLLHKQRTELAVSQPAFNSTVISNPLHKSTLFCTHLRSKTAAWAWKDKTRGRRKGDSHSSFLLPLYSLSLIHSFTSAIIWCILKAAR